MDSTQQAINNLLAELRTQRDEKEKSSTQMSTDIAVLKGNVEHNQEMLKQEINNTTRCLERSVNSLQDKMVVEINRNKRRYDDLQSLVKSLEESVTDIGRQFVEIKLRLTKNDSLQQQINQIDSRVNTQISDLSNDINGLVLKIDKLDSSRKTGIGLGIIIFSLIMERIILNYTF